MTSLASERNVRKLDGPPAPVEWVDEWAAGALDGMLDSLVGCDSGGKIRYVNRATERTFGYRADELLGRDVSILMPEPYRATHPAHFSRYSRTGEKTVLGMQGRRLWGRRKDGRVFPCEVSANDVPGSGDRRVVATMRDVSDRVRLENEAREARERAERAAEAKSMFIGKLSHEMRSPLGVVAGFAARLLRKGGLSEPQIRAIRHMETAAGHMTALLSDALDLAKIEAGVITIRPESIRVDDVIDESVDCIADHARSKRIEFSVDTNGARRGFIADRARLRQVLDNLLANAIKFTPAGGRIEVSANIDGRPPTLHLAVSDTGPGIPDEFRADVFSEFGRGPNAAGQSDGHGLGLAIARQIVEHQGGRIWFESRPGRGTTFRISLPECGDGDTSDVSCRIQDKGDDS